MRLPVYRVSNFELDFRVGFSSSISCWIFDLDF